MKDETKEIKEIKASEETERGGQCELDDNVLEQAAGGGPLEWVKRAKENISK